MRADSRRRRQSPHGRRIRNYGRGRLPHGAHPHPHAGGAPTHNGRRAPELTAGIGRVNSAKSIGVCTGNWPTLRQAQAPLNAPDITTAQEARDSAIVAVLLGCALRRSEVAALADGRCSGDRRRLPAQLSASGPAGSPSGRRSRSRTRRTSRTPRACAPAPSSRRAARLRPAPFRGGGAHRWALFGRIHAGGDGRRAARGCVEAVGVVCPTSRPATKCELDGQLTWRGLTRTNRATPARTPQQCQLPDVRQSGSWAISLWHRGVAGDLDSLTGGGGSRPDACPTATAACGGWRPALPR